MTSGLLSIGACGGGFGLRGGTEEFLGGPTLALRDLSITLSTTSWTLAIGPFCDEGSVGTIEIVVAGLRFFPAKTEDDFGLCRLAGDDSFSSSAVSVAELSYSSECFFVRIITDTKG